MSSFPPAVQRLFWDVDPSTVDLDRHRRYVMERVMSRGTWEAMRWLLGAYPVASLRDFVEQDGVRVLTPRALAFWALMTDADVEIRPGGGRPAWAGA